MDREGAEPGREGVEGAGQQTDTTRPVNRQLELSLGQGSRGHVDVKGQLRSPGSRFASVCGSERRVSMSLFLS